MLETEAIHLVARLDGVRPVDETDKGKTLGHACFPILGEENSGDTAEALEHVTQLVLFRHLGDLEIHKSAPKLETRQSAM